MFGKKLTHQKIAHRIVVPYFYMALREGLITHNNGNIQMLRGLDSSSFRPSFSLLLIEKFYIINTSLFELKILTQ